MCGTCAQIPERPDNSPWSVREREKRKACAERQTRREDDLSGATWIKTQVYLRKYKYQSNQRPENEMNMSR
jgi:hypothetical protein